MVRFVFLFLVLSSIAAQARIGENLAECETRYGPVVEHRKAGQKDSDADAQVFSKSGITVVAEFHAGVVWKIVYSKVGMEQAEVEALLAANAKDSSWTAPLKITGQEIRATASRDRFAIYTPGRRLDTLFTLAVASAEYAKANRTDYLNKLTTVPVLLKERIQNGQLKGF